MVDPAVKRDRRDRAAHYRQMALDALRQAVRAASSRQRDLWLQLAQNWQAKAVELESQNDQPPRHDFYSALAAVLTRPG